MWVKVLAVAVLLLSASTAMGASGTLVDADRDDATRAGPVVVAAGDSALTSVEPGEPAIDLRTGSAAGIAPGTTLTIGDPDDPAAAHAFSLHNTGEDPVDVAIRYRYDAEPPDPAGVSFTVYGPDGTELGGPDAATIAPGETAYVVVVIDSTGTTAGDDLSGTVSVVVA